MNVDALSWALTIEPPGVTEFGLLVYLAQRVAADFSVEMSLKAAAKELGSATNTLSRALNTLARAELVTVEQLDKVGGVYEAGRGRRVLLSHPAAPHMCADQVAERAEDKARRAAVRASLPEDVWESLKPARTETPDDEEDQEAPMVTKLERRGLRLLTASPAHQERQEHAQQPQQLTAW
ncbi:hypothetical protein D5S17_29010 [Pseudonocardiaceae bacterium YIM PH 21723]|nr:hypothetical protein D5S17_29010 [Pseudonocardiaceae bacterium YIM PH 21723]